MILYNIILLLFPIEEVSGKKGTCAILDLPFSYKNDLTMWIMLRGRSRGGGGGGGG